MTSQDRYGAAVHEAGHVVVAWAMGLKTNKMLAGIDGDDAAGRAEIEFGTHLPLVDQIATYAAGADAQRLLGAPTHDLAEFADIAAIRNLIDDLEESAGEALLYAGYRRSKELLQQHRAKLETLAAMLADRGELQPSEIEEILRSDDR